MGSFFQRLFGRLFSNVSTPPEKARTVKAGPAPAPAPRMVEHDADLLAATLAGARRTLVSSVGAVVGFEFRVHEDIQHRVSQRADKHGRAAHVAAVLTSARLTARAGRVGFARFPMDWLRQASSLDDVAGIMIGLEPAAMDPDSLGATAQIVLQLRAAGATVGWDAITDLGMAPDFLLLRQGRDPMAALLEGLKTWPTRLRVLPILVTDISQVEDVELALLNGVSWVCGALAPTAGANPDAKKQAVSPQVRRIAHLLNQLATGVDTAAIVHEIKGDVGLSYRLLRRINSASFAQLSEGASIEQAVLMLGRNELYRWMSLLLLQYAGSRKVSSALQEVALWRSRFLELLAIERHEETPGQFFTLGLASMLGEILKMGMADVVQTLNLPPQARQALLQNNGPWNIYLHVIQQIEAHEFPDANSDQFGGVARVLALSDEAWIWSWAAGQAGREGD